MHVGESPTTSDFRFRGVEQAFFVAGIVKASTVDSVAILNSKKRYLLRLLLHRDFSLAVGTLFQAAVWIELKGCSHNSRRGTARPVV